MSKHMEDDDMDYFSGDDNSSNEDSDEEIEEEEENVDDNNDKKPSEDNEEEDPDFNESEDEEDEYDEEEGEGEEEEEKISPIRRGGASSQSLDLEGSLQNYRGGEDDEDEEDEEIDENYLQKFDVEVNKNYISEFHPECFTHNYEEINTLTQVVRDVNYNIIDPLHKTIPFLTKYEKARIIGIRAKQINSGAKPYIKVPENVIDGYLIAEMELKEKRIPFIIKRPLAGGTCEYWKLQDLEIIGF